MSFSRTIVPSGSPGGWWGDHFAIPHGIADQNFGMGIFKDDFVMPSLMHNYYVTPRRHHVRHGGTSHVKNEDMKFTISLDVNHFKPGEITVKTVDDSVVVHGKHEERSDEHGFITREFTRRYVLPEGILPETVTTSLTPDGFLVVEAPKKSVEPLKKNERVVPIIIKEMNQAVIEKIPEKKSWK